MFKLILFDIQLLAAIKKDILGHPLFEFGSYVLDEVLDSCILIFSPVKLELVDVVSFNVQFLAPYTFYARSSSRL